MGVVGSTGSLVVTRVVMGVATNVGHLTTDPSHVDICPHLLHIAEIQKGEANISPHSINIQSSWPVPVSLTIIS